MNAAPAPRGAGARGRPGVPAAAAPQRLAVDDVPAQPWRNGGGHTRELWTWPADGPWQARLSVADIAADGPFSAFPGIERHFAVLSGEGVELALPGGPRRVGPRDPACRFDGGAAPGCRLLGGPTRDLNLMLRGLDGGLAPVAVGRPWPAPRGAGAVGLVALVAGHLPPGGAAPDQSDAVPDGPSDPCEGAWSLAPWTLARWCGPIPATLHFAPAQAAATRARTTAPPGWWWWVGTPAPAR
ncbi:HutD/Ves family protein [Piscinibacter sakaiensis]|uniref:HutD family protein n=1 Tax=Piscinibacter sakaiensis TaxID=1547922 RepID=A0A0K8NX38_PISS1|nr:HutD family protein [Piscinibacter sakaiensis]GAP34967.1 conserved hypothetical protein [Piscinibacter sakaiensis]